MLKASIQARLPFQKSLQKKTFICVFAFFFFWFCAFSWYWYHALQFNAQGDVVVDGHLWGDWAAHFTMGSTYAYREMWPASNPFLLGQFFNYPFLINWFSGMLIRIGVPFFTAFILPSWVLSLFLVMVVFVFFVKILRSQLQAICASTLFFLNGGAGIMYFFQDLLASSSKLDFLIHQQKWYTALDNLDIHWMLLTKNLFFPQRGFTIGFPLTLVAFFLLWKALPKLLQSNDRNSALLRKRLPTLHHKHLKQVWVGQLYKQRLMLMASGLLIGSLPLIHVHSFVVALIVCGVWCVSDILRGITEMKKMREIKEMMSEKNAPHTKPMEQKVVLRNWLWFWGAVGILAIPIWKVYFWGQPTAIRFLPGWIATEEHHNWLLFWLNNWGLTLPAAVFGMMIAWRQKRAQLWKMCGPFVLIFIIANLFVFQPWSWDNTKLLAWSALGICGFVVFGLTFLWHQWQNKWARTGVRIGVVVVYIILISTGAVDTFRLLLPENNKFVIYTQEELQLAEWVKLHTPPEGVWLTGTKHNHWLFNLTGRQTIMTYPGWLWSYGYHYQEIERDVETMRLQPLTANARILFDKYHVEYIVADEEMLPLWIQAGTVLPKVFPAELIMTSPHYSIYHLRK